MRPQNPFLDHFTSDLPNINNNKNLVPGCVRPSKCIPVTDPPQKGKASMYGRGGAGNFYSPHTIPHYQSNEGMLTKAFKRVKLMHFSRRSRGHVLGLDEWEWNEKDADDDESDLG